MTKIICREFPNSTASAVHQNVSINVLFFFFFFFYIIKSGQILVIYLVNNYLVNKCNFRIGASCPIAKLNGHHCLCECRAARKIDFHENRN